MSTRRQHFICGLALLLGSLSAFAQTRYTLSGTEYELVTWPAAPMGTSSLTSDTWSADFGAGQITVAGTGMESAPATVDDFYNAPVYAGAGYGITATPLFRVNNGQTEPAGNDLAVSYQISAAALPTELLFYAGGDALGTTNSGLKYVRWDWSSTQPGTRFEVLAHTASFTITGSGSAALSWRTFGTDNNTAMALVRITNPSGISDFTVTSNRLTTAGADTVYGNTNQRADYNGIAILAPRPAAAQPVPTLSAGSLALLVAALTLGASVARQRRG